VCRVRAPSREPESLCSIGDVPLGSHVPLACEEPIPCVPDRPPAGESDGPTTAIATHLHRPECVAGRFFLQSQPAESQECILVQFRRSGSLSCGYGHRKARGVASSRKKDRDKY
jgi:hypothetical protein